MDDNDRAQERALVFRREEKMSKSIRVSKKHGLNPCIPICPFCGQEKNELALLGYIKGDKEAPKSAIINLEPCDTCKENWKKGVPLIRVSHACPAEGMPPISKPDGKPVYLTGNYVVITKDAAKRLFDIDVNEGSPMLMEDVAFDEFMAEARKAEG